jgi:hypothetical protein
VAHFRRSMRAGLPHVALALGFLFGAPTEDNGLQGFGVFRGGATHAACGAAAVLLRLQFIAASNCSGLT